MYINSSLKLIFILPALPRFVVINITPLAPLEPYMAVSAASFKTEMDLISSIFSSFKSRSILSTKTRGLVPPPKVDIPRIQNSDIFLPGCPDCIIPIIPATFPASALEMLEVGFCFMSSTSTVDTAPVRDIFFCLPKPTITTSSKLSVSSSSTISKFV